jgi:hypothetical protein
VASLAIACAGSAEPDANSATSETPAAESFEYAPTESPKPTLEERVAANQLVAKGTIDVKRSATFNYAYAIPPGKTLTLYTTGATSTIDPVCVIYTRTDQWMNSTAWVDTPSSKYQAQLTTLAINDDRAPRNYNSKVSYKNIRGDTFTVRAMCFAYENRTIDYAKLPVWQQIDNDAPVNLGSKFIVSGSYYKTDAATTLTTTGGGNPVLLAFPTTVGAGYGAWNDDSPDGGTESKLTGLAASVPYWIVPMVYPSTPDRTTGMTTINF